MKYSFTQEELKKILDYNPETGIFTWRIKPSKKIKQGSLAGSVWNMSSGARRFIQIRKNHYAAARLAWVYMYGVQPNGVIDHINGDALDNRIINLRDVSQRENSKNRKTPKNNKSGFNGVCICSTTGRWQAYIRMNDKLKSLGRFKTKEEAIKARKAANVKYGYHENHGR